MAISKPWTRLAAEYPWVQVAALARSCTLDVERAASALQHAKRPRIHTFIATSDIHLKYKLKKTQQQVLDEAVAAVELARRHCRRCRVLRRRRRPHRARVSGEDFESRGRRRRRTVNIPDTVGYSVPEEYGALIGNIVKALGDCAIVSVHCHDDLGLAVANSIAAVQAGARQIECTINGIGERAGNCSLEEVVMAMKTRNDRFPFQTGIHTEHLYSASQLLSSIITFGPQPNKAIVGRNAFAHEAGIHQDGYLKEKSTYEIIDPKSVGVPEGKLVLGKHSGRHALKQRCEHLGFSLTKDELDVVYTQFTALADRKKGILDEEIANLIVAAGHAARPTFAGK